MKAGPSTQNLSLRKDSFPCRPNHFCWGGEVGPSTQISWPLFEARAAHVAKPTDLRYTSRWDHFLTLTSRIPRNVVYLRIGCWGDSFGHYRGCNMRMETITQWGAF